MKTDTHAPSYFRAWPNTFQAKNRYKLFGSREPIYTAAALTKAHGKCMENGRENMHTDVRVKRIKLEQDLKA